jgi:hypothetical protein
VRYRKSSFENEQTIRIWGRRLDTAPPDDFLAIARKFTDAEAGETSLLRPCRACAHIRRA